jgi:hypothetical protein
VAPTGGFRLTGRVPDWAKAALPKRETVIAKHKFVQIGPKQLALQVGTEVVELGEKTNERGWMHTRRVSDGKQGSFPELCIECSCEDAIVVSVPGDAGWAFYACGLSSRFGDC